jgi:glycosyltransferase involved in cell wall biosynthesis
MKITIFSDSVAPFRIGWADEMGKTNEVTFAYVKNSDSECNDSWLAKTSNYAKLVKIPSHIIKNCAVTSGVVKYIKKNPSDIVIFDGYATFPNILGIWYMTSQKKRFFVNVDGAMLDAKQTIIKRMIKKSLFSRYAYFLCSSEFTERCMHCLGVSKNHTIAHNFSSLHDRDILNHVPTSEERTNMRVNLKLKDVCTVLAVGRFIELKQFDKLIEAFRPYDAQAQLVIIGEGYEKKTYEELVSKFQLNNVRIIDFMTFEELKNYYMASDIFVLPSYSEVWGLVVNEAMGCGALPVIVSDRCVSGYSLAVDGVTGYQFPYNSVEDLSKKIGILLYDFELRQKMSSAALEMISHYTIENTAKIHMEWFKQLIKNDLQE